ncbi:MAG: YidC/Oxa1 family insertase periplasmic-domain containing protein, partial [Myxococcales bacterium]|nr:YidC/Oxa1 family insertase periplasmic-domain containing protein [Myxococcales bacterium]
VTATLALNATSSIQKTLTFYGNRYEVGVSVALPGMDHIIANHRYEFSWKSGLQYQELYSDKESDASKALIVQNKNIEELDATDVAAPVQTSGSGTIDYAAIKSKYFVAAIIPRVVNGDAAVYLDGKRHVAERGGFIEQYDMALRLPTTTSGKTDRFTVYVGPLDYDVVKQYGLESTVEFGARWIIRPIGEFFMLPFFQAIYRVIPNYGIAIIVFSLLLRILMQPLMASQMRSSQKMQVLAPEMEKLLETRQIFRIVSVQYVSNPCHIRPADVGNNAVAGAMGEQRPHLRIHVVINRFDAGIGFQKGFGFRVNPFFGPPAKHPFGPCCFFSCRFLHFRSHPLSQPGAYSVGLFGKFAHRFFRLLQLGRSFGGFGGPLRRLGRPSRRSQSTERSHGSPDVQSCPQNAQCQPK